MSATVLKVKPCAHGAGKPRKIRSHGESDHWDPGGTQVIKKQYPALTSRGSIMPEYTVKFANPDRSTMILPTQLLRGGGRYMVGVHDGDVYISGNSDGLLYLAEALVQSAMGDFAETFHVHLPLDSTGPQSLGEVRSELVIFAGEL